MLRNKNTGAFEVYEIANNQLGTTGSLGQVGLDCQLGGFAAVSAGTELGGKCGVDQLVTTRPTARSWQAPARRFDSGGSGRLRDPRLACSGAGGEHG